MQFKRRTHTCGELRESNIGENVALNGWVDRRRDLGGVIFIEIRDRHGITQVVFEPTFDEQAHHAEKDLRSEFVISVEGVVRKRPADTDNPDLATGYIDVMVNNLIILNEAETPPFAIKDDIDTHEDLRLKYRYIDLRRPKMQNYLRMRHTAAMAARNFLSKKDFLEVLLMAKFK